MLYLIVFLIIGRAHEAVNAQLVAIPPLIVHPVGQESTTRGLVVHLHAQSLLVPVELMNHCFVTWIGRERFGRAAPGCQLICVAERPPAYLADSVLIASGSTHLPSMSRRIMTTRIHPSLLAVPDQRFQFRLVSNGRVVSSTRWYTSGELSNLKPIAP